MYGAVGLLLAEMKDLTVGSADRLLRRVVRLMKRTSVMHDLSRDEMSGV